MKWLISIAAVVAIVLLGFFVFSTFRATPSSSPVTILGTTVPPIPTLSRESLALGKQVYDQYCADCHGGNLEGVPDWKIPQADGSLLPPPHNSSGHTWHHPDPVLIEIITNGGDPTLYNTKMPGFGDRLTEAEIETVLDYIKSHWKQEDREYQWWMTARDE